jgi:hypothetical protein
MLFKRLATYRMVKILQVLCAVYVVVVTYMDSAASHEKFGSINPETGTIIDPASPERTEDGVILHEGILRAGTAETNWQLFCLGAAKVAAFAMYPTIALVFISKCRATIGFLGSSPVVMYMFKDSHHLHVYSGHFIFWSGLIHSLFHILRWADQGNMYLLVQNRGGLSGLVALIFLLFICIPMMFQFFRRRITFENRKFLHYGFYGMAIALAFHAPPSALPTGGFCAYVFPILLGWYTLDLLFVIFFMTEKVTTPIVQVLPTGVHMAMTVSNKFHARGNHGGIAYICLPWVSRNQWHAFSLYENNHTEMQREVFMSTTGDWTEQVHKEFQRNTVRPVWIQGPFLTPYSNAESYGNQIMVASGIGITPALSIIRAHKESRRTNLIWAVRDPNMLEFYLEHSYLDHTGWNLIFYTGNEPLNPALEELNTNVRIIKGRPKLAAVIPNVIYGIETGTGIPERYLPQNMLQVQERLLDVMYELKDTKMSNRKKLLELKKVAQSEGFLFTNLIAQLENDNVEEESRRACFALNEENDNVKEENSRACFASNEDLRPSLISTAPSTGGPSVIVRVIARGRLLLEGGVIEDRGEPDLGSEKDADEPDSGSERDADSNDQDDMIDSNYEVDFEPTLETGDADDGNVVARPEKEEAEEKRRRVSMAPNEGAVSDKAKPRPSLSIVPSLRSNSQAMIPHPLTARLSMTAHQSTAVEEAREYATRILEFIAVLENTQDEEFDVRLLYEDDDTDDGERVHQEDVFRPPQFTRQQTVSTQGLSTSAHSGLSVASTHLDSSQHSIPPLLSKRIALVKRRSERICNGSLVDNMTASFVPWEENHYAAKCVKEMDQRVLNTWGILYCGGSQVVEQTLKEIAQVYKVGLHTESFEW